MFSTLIVIPEGIREIDCFQIQLWVSVSMTATFEWVDHVLLFHFTLSYFIFTLNIIFNFSKYFAFLLLFCFGLNIFFLILKCCERVL